MTMSEAFKLHRSSDPDTSVEAAYQIFPWATYIQKRIIKYAIERGADGFTDEDLSTHFDNHTSTLRSRRAELSHHKVIVDSGLRSILKSGRRGIVWVYYKHHTPIVPENDGQPDEAQEWADFDPDC